MRIAVINGSPKGELGVTVQYLRYVAKRYPAHEFTVHHVSQLINALDKDPAKLAAVARDMAASDGVMFVTPVYYLLAPSQLQRFLELLGQCPEAAGLAGRPAGVLTTSIHFFDHLCHEGMAGAIEDLGMTLAGSYSADMKDLLDPARRQDLLSFAAECFDAMASRRPMPQRSLPLPGVPSLDLSGQPAPATRAAPGKTAAIVADNLTSSPNLAAMVERLAQGLGPSTTVVDLATRRIKGGCLGCCECGLDNLCAYHGSDEVEGIYDETLRRADIVVFAGRTEGRFFSSELKRFIDRGFFRNHSPMFPGRQMAWLIDGPIRSLPHLREMIQAYAENHDAGLCAVVGSDQDAAATAQALDALAKLLASRAASGYVQPKTFLGHAGRKLFRDDLYGRLRFVFQADHRYYKSHGFYDFPQKDNKMRLTNAVFMTLTRIPAFRNGFRKMIKSKMAEPYRKIVEQEKE